MWAGLFGIGLISQQRGFFVRRLFFVSLFFAAAFLVDALDAIERAL